MKTAILSLLIAIAVAAFGYYQFQQFQNNQQEIQAVQQSLTNLDQKISKIDANANQTNTTLQELSKKYHSLTQEGDWKIEEVTHFLRLAGIELQISRDIPTTIRLLDAADNLLSTIPDPKFFPVREQIAKEKSSLVALQLPDLAKLWVDVGALMDKIPSLPTRGFRPNNAASSNPTAEKNVEQDLASESEKGSLKSQKSEKSLKSEKALKSEKPEKTEKYEKSTNTEQESKKLEQSTATEDQNNNQWSEGLSHTWQEMKELIKIQRHTKPIEPILKEPEQALARENLFLLFEQIRLAIMQQNDKVYQRSILETKQWLSDYFEANDREVERLQSSLDELAKINLRPGLPEIGQALKTLQNKG